MHAPSRNQATSRAAAVGAARLALLVALLALAAALPGATASTPDWTKAKPEVVVKDLAMPADIQVAPDGAIWFVELAGDVSRYDPATGKVALVRHVDDVVTGTERGLAGFALAADFARSGTYFLYYTERNDDPDGATNHLVRVDGDKVTVLLTVTGHKEHNGGRIAVDKDGNLFVGIGENQKRDPAQDMSSNLGKILHMTPDGKPVAGNMQGLIYSKGHRNPYGLAIHPTTGEPWETENSGWRRDEINIIKPGGNYGYPECEGLGLNGVSTPCPTDKGYTFPVRTFYEDHTAAPTGVTFWRGEFYWASLNEGSIHHLWQDPATQAWEDKNVFDPKGMPILDLAVGTHDELYFSTMDSIQRITLPNEDVKQTGDAAPLGTGGATQGSSSKGASAPAMAAVLAVLAVGLVARRARLA
ncbi:MAG TPA: PQQ-dependent sugar dehydrogenase [Candidatus Thermoplasmatota archaeon]|nr:PQQ-dependent sugar dehydrogenase [Candidatus Thermoplasmatota archaeon]